MNYARNEGNFDALTERRTSFVFEGGLSWLKVFCGSTCSPHLNTGLAY